jgi:hypothetical protein
LPTIPLDLLHLRTFLLVCSTLSSRALAFAKDILLADQT